MNLESTQSALIADTPEGFAAAIVRAMADQDLRKTLAENGKKLISEHFSLDVARVELGHLLNSNDSKGTRQSQGV
jgi:hypothetical protein